MTSALSVILAEDDADLGLIYGTYLRRAGHNVMLVTDGLAALRVVETAEPDILILDLNMPRLGGEDTLRRLRTNPRTQDLPVVLFTNRELDDASAETLAALGVEAFITKVTMPPGDLAGWLGRWAEGRATPLRREPRERGPGNS